MSTSICRELAWDGLVSPPKLVKDFYPLKKIGTGSNKPIGFEMDLVYMTRL